jgi:hypothetical protein
MLRWKNIQLFDVIRDSSPGRHQPSISILSPTIELDYLIDQVPFLVWLQNKVIDSHG